MSGDCHAWDVTPREAVAIQEQWRGRLREEPLDLDQVRLVAGCDLSATRQRGDVYAGLVVLELASGETVDQAAIATTTQFPYVPGLLSFREIPPLLAAWANLSVTPDVLIADGHGKAHPRRFGLASHLGVVLDLPTMGCAKRVFVGNYESVAAERGATAELRDGDETIGMALRTRARVKPVFVSVGHRCRLEDAVALVLRCATGYRLPEPTRRAHRLVNEVRRREMEP